MRVSSLILEPIRDVQFGSFEQSNREESKTQLGIGPQENSPQSLLIKHKPPLYAPPLHSPYPGQSLTSKQAFKSFVPPIHIPFLYHCIFRKDSL